MGQWISGPRLPTLDNGYEATCFQEMQGPEHWGGADTPIPTPARTPGTIAPTLGASSRWASATQGGPELLLGPFTGEQRRDNEREERGCRLRQFILMPLIQFQHN